MTWSPSSAACVARRCRQSSSIVVIVIKVVDLRRYLTAAHAPAEVVYIGILGAHFRTLLFRGPQS